jgi:hypothetical protein
MLDNVLVRDPEECLVPDTPPLRPSASFCLVT